MRGVALSGGSNDTGGNVTAQDRRTAFGQALKAAREARGWSQRKLASEAGLSGSQIGHMETGKLGGKDATVRKLEDALGLPPGDLGAFLGYTAAPPSLEAAIKADKRLPPSVKRALLAVITEFEPDEKKD